MIANDVAVEQRHLPAKLLKQHGQYFRRRRFARRAETRKPDTKTLLVPRRINVGDRVRHFRPREPRRQLRAATAIPLAHHRARKLRGRDVRADLVHVFITIFLRQINKLAKRQHAYADLFRVALDELLRGVRRIKRLTGRVVTGARMIASDDHVICAVVSTDQRVPQRLTWPGEPHCERQQREQDAFGVVVFLRERFVSADAREVIEIAGLGHADDGM